VKAAIRGRPTPMDGPANGFREGRMRKALRKRENIMTRTIKALLLTTSVLGMTGIAQAADVTLTIESWRNDDLSIWQEKLIPAFEAKNPGIKVVFSPTAPTEYNAALNAKLDAGSAGDLISCLQQDAFDKLGIAVPKTNDEFFAALDKIKADGTYVPMAMGTKDLWEAATMGYQNIGPTYWKGEEGRLALIKGEQKLTDADWVEPYRVLAKWKPYLGDGFEAQTYPDSQNMFTLGRAAIYPAGSWEISQFNSQADFKMGAFPPPVQKDGDTCYISDHNDIGMGLNAKSGHQEEAKKFLSWVASPEFAEIYANALPGFFSLNSTAVKMSDPLAQEFVSWREKCKPTIRSTYQILSRGTPNLENETWVESANVINGTDTPEQAGEKLQKGLDSWYKPAK